MAHTNSLFGICPLTTVQIIVAGKWKLLIVYFIANGSTRFCTLRHRLPGCTQTMLTNQLRGLENDGLLTRTVYAEVPPHVEYSLTEAGEKLIPIIQKLAEWGVFFLKDVYPDMQAERASKIAKESEAMDAR